MKINENDIELKVKNRKYWFCYYGYLRWQIVYANSPIVAYPNERDEVLIRIKNNLLKDVVVNLTSPNCMVRDLTKMFQQENI